MEEGEEGEGEEERRDATTPPVKDDDKRSSVQARSKHSHTATGKHGVGEGKGRHDSSVLARSLGLSPTDGKVDSHPRDADAWKSSLRTSAAPKSRQKTGVKGRLSTPTRGGGGSYAALAAKRTPPDVKASKARSNAPRLHTQARAGHKSGPPLHDKRGGGASGGEARSDRLNGSRASSHVPSNPFELNEMEGMQA
uniref:Uncharacterized protein n=1 Tax=Palpitomonas bilix TaxID=652834 RepID=A0A7S3GIF3_9EUKA